MRFRCYNPTCGTVPRGFVFEGDIPQCPKCGRIGQPGVQELTDVHFVVMGTGPIFGGAGKQHIACQPLRDCMARHLDDQFAATDDPRSVTCRSCKGTPAYQDMAKLFPEIALGEAMDRARGITVAAGCGGCK